MTTVKNFFFTFAFTINNCSVRRI